MGRARNAQKFPSQPVHSRLWSFTETEMSKDPPFSSEDPLSGNRRTPLSLSHHPTPFPLQLDPVSLTGLVPVEQLENRDQQACGPP